MPKEVRLRRGTTAQHTSFTGAEGEVTYDTTTKLLRIHDGVTAGGFDMSRFLLKTPATILTLQTFAGILAITGGDSDNYGLSVLNQAVFNQVLINQDLQVKRYALLGEALVYAGSVLLDFNTFGSKRLTLGGNVTFTCSGYGFGKYMRVKVTCDASLRTLTFPAGWKFIGSAAPANIAANKVALLELFSDGTTEADTMARWAVQP